MQLEYPDLFDAADKRSAQSQRLHFSLILTEYAVLLGTALVAWLGEAISIPSGVYVLAFLSLVSVATMAHILKPDQNWYHARAMAESIRTISWRFMMRAVPFEDVDKVATAKAAYADHLKDILDNSRKVGVSVTVNDPGKPQITESMEAVRRLGIAERLEIYRTERVDDQKKWYAMKSRYNGRLSSIWYTVICSVYIVPVILIVLDIVEVRSNWTAVSIFLLLGSSILGWTKSKRYSELATSYALAAQEIAILSEMAATVETETQLSDFVNSAELAFSREHTQWVARRN